MSAPSLPELTLRLLWVRWKLARHGFAASAAGYLEQTAEQSWPAADKVVRRLRQIARCLPGTSCLHRSLALIEAAQARGISARLVLGVQRVDGQSRAHAWVQMAGECLGELHRDGRAYSPLPSPGSGQ